MLLCFFYVTDGWKVYPMFIEEGDQIVSKTANRAGGYLQLASGGCAYMTRVEAACRRAEYSVRRTALVRTPVCDITWRDCIAKPCATPSLWRC